MADIIQNKMAQILGDLARPSKYKCEIILPKEIKLNIAIGEGTNAQNVSAQSAMEYLDYFCMVAKMPGLTVETIDFKWKGRNLPVKSVQNYEQKWQATFYNDENHSVRQMFLNWMLYDQVHQYENKKGNKFSHINPAAIGVYQLDYELSKNLVVYILANVYPTNVGDVELSYDGINQVETFTVEFAYTHFEIQNLKGGGLTASDISSLIKNTAQNILNGIFDAAGEFVSNKINDFTSDFMENTSIGNFIGNVSDDINNFLG